MQTLIVLIISVLVLTITTITESHGDVYVKFDGIDGESTDEGHGGWIEAISISDTGNKKNLEKTGGNEVILIKNIDKASPKLSEAVARGAIFEKLTIHIVNQEDTKEYIFENVRIVGYKVQFQDDFSTYEEISLNFAKITEQHMGSFTKPKVPTWVQTTAKFWTDGLVSDKEFVDALGFLVKQKIILVEVEAVNGKPGDENVPTWIVQTTKWWISGEVPEDQFLGGIKWMIKNNIIKGIKD